ncbi:MAG: hypothetical protein EOP11_09160 [Proteobacteria bacterium]|nr:MAG: hypothetical protein EOP11_09160 [Pseudomonadota bacterium]
MKLFLALSLLAVPAFSAWFSGEGNYVLDHEISFLSYENQMACEGDNGRWEDGLCIFAGADEVTVKRAGLSYDVKVSTVTTNAHMCEFEGKGVFQGDGTLKAAAPAEVWNDDRQEWEAATCEVTLSFASGNEVNVTNNGSCQSFCGMRASLDVAGATRREANAAI